MIALNLTTPKLLTQSHCETRLPSYGTLSLSLEEQAELARSNKKVKNVNHAGFCEGQSSGSPSPSFAEGQGSQNASFRDKLMGEIPGAYT